MSLVRGHCDYSCMTEVVKDIASSMWDIKVEIMHPILYDEVMYMSGFPDEALIIAYSHLLDNKPQGDAFVNMTDSHHVL